MATYKYLITKEDDFKALVQYLDEGHLFAYDTETNAKFSQYEVQMVGMSFGFADFCCYIPFMHTEGHQLDISWALPQLKPFFEDPTREYVAHHAKFDEMVLKVHGINCKGIGHDTLVMAWLLQHGRESKGLKPQVLQRLGIAMETYEEVVDRRKRKRGEAKDYTFAKVSLADALSYASEDAYYTYRLFETMVPLLKEEGLWNAYDRIERPLVRVVGGMERYGVLIDRPYIEKADVEFPKIKEEVCGEVYGHAGEVFNIGSSQQVKYILLDKLKIATAKELPKTKSGAPSFDKDVLKMLRNRHPVVEHMLRVKKITKIHGTFVKGLMEKIDKDHRIHASFNAQGTDTGRFSCNNPNLQQIEGDEVEGIKIRNFFIAPQGRCLVVGDYSQIELRILAHLSKDQNMIDAFNSGRDFHDETARKMLEMQGTPIPPEVDVLPRQRFNAKALNFGIPYGRGPGSVAEQLGVEPFCGHWPQPYRNDNGDIVYKNGRIYWGFGTNGRIPKKMEVPCHNCGKCFIEDWFAAFPDVRVFKEKVLAETRARGYVRTLAGRKRYLPDINSSRGDKKGEAERRAFNTKIQGSAADIIKLAMVALDEPLRDLGAQMILTVHDELGVESPISVAEDVRVTMRDIMGAPLDGKNPLCLALKTDPNIGMKWGEAK